MIQVKQLACDPGIHSNPLAKKLPQGIDYLNCSPTIEAPNWKQVESCAGQTTPARPIVKFNRFNKYAFLEKKNGTETHQPAITSG